MRPHDLLVKNFWLHVILMHIWDSAMSRSYALFSCVYSWDWSLLHGLDHVSLCPVASGQFVRSRSLRLHRNRASTMGCAVSHSHVCGLLRTCVSWSGCAILHSHVCGLLHAHASLMHGPMTGDSCMTFDDLGQYCESDKNIRQIQTTWYSVELCIET